jgi:hypothetical protein
VFNESVKNYPDRNEPYHFIKTHNYIGGLRLSYQRASLTNRTTPYDDAIQESRKKNYVGMTNNNFDKVDKTPFGRNQVEYSDSGGYYGKGGFIFYFESDWTIVKAKEYYENLVADDMYDTKFISLTLEVSINI